MSEAYYGFERVRYWASARAAAGVSQDLIDVPGPVSLAALVDLLEAALATEEPGIIGLPSAPGEGPSLQDLISDTSLDITVHDGFDYWLEGGATPTLRQRAARGGHERSPALPLVRVGDDPCRGCDVWSSSAFLLAPTIDALPASVRAAGTMSKSRWSASMICRGRVICTRL